MRSVVYYVENLAITWREPMPKLRHQMNDNVQMLGNAALMALPKVAFLSSRRVAPAAVMRCYDWATGMRGGGRGATTLSVTATSAGAPATGETPVVPVQRTRCPLSQSGGARDARPTDMRANRQSGRPAGGHGKRQECRFPEVRTFSGKRRSRRFVCGGVTGCCLSCFHSKEITVKNEE